MRSRVTVPHAAFVARLAASVVAIAIAIAIGLGTMSGCGSTIVDAGNFDRVCASDVDCVVVLSGDVCGCGTPAAIASGSRQAFDNAVANAQKSCFNESTGIGVPDCPPLTGTRALCGDHSLCTVTR